MTSKKFKSGAEIFPIFFAIFYIFSELIFNISLIDFISSPNTEIDTFHNLELFGRSLSSIGFALIITKLVNKFIKTNMIATTSVFVATTIVSLLMQTVIFNKILDNMTSEQKLSAYAFGVYRNLNLNNQVNLKILNGQNEKYDEVVNSMFGLFTTIPESERYVTQTVKQFFTAENNVDQAMLNSIYDEIQVVQPNTNEYWNLYTIESRRFANYSGFFKENYRGNFQRTLGIPPGLSRAEFDFHLKSKSSGINEFKKIVIIPANEQLKMQSLKFGDIPEGLSKTDWVSFINNHINSAIENSKFDKKNVDNLPHSRNIISSVVITPIAVILSLLALCLNVAFLIMRFSSIAGSFVLVGFFAIAGTFSYNPYKFNPVINALVGLETYTMIVVSPLKSVVHNIFIDDNSSNSYNIIRLEKPNIPDTSKLKNELDEKFKLLKSDADEIDNQSNETFNSVAKEIKVDEVKVDDPNYYGELKKENMYIK